MSNSTLAALATDLDIEVDSHDDSDNEIERGPSGPDEPVPWTERPLTELVFHIVTRYHGGLRRDLPGLIAMARKVEQRHGKRAAHPTGLADKLTAMAEELESHLDKEERILFPMIVAGRGRLAGGPITVMTREHDDHGEALEWLREHAGGFMPPAEACATWRALYRGLSDLEADLMAHIHLENHVLFPRAMR
jgi:regulator of cell morphogenesis and NO signaling